MARYEAELQDRMCLDESCETPRVVLVESVEAAVLAAHFGQPLHERAHNGLLQPPHD